MGFRFKDPESGEWVDVIAPPGKSAYQYAKDGGFVGTEEDFARKMASETTDATFYNSLFDAVTDINEGTNDKALKGSENAKVRVFRNDEGRLTVSLQGDITEKDPITSQKSLDIMLCGHKIILDGIDLRFATGTKVRICGGLNSDGGTRGQIIRKSVTANSFIIGGNYTELVIVDTEILAVDEENTNQIIAIYLSQKCNYAQVHNCLISIKGLGVKEGILVHPNAKVNLSVTDSSIAINGSSGTCKGIEISSAHSKLIVERTQMEIMSGATEFSSLIGIRNSGVADIIDLTVKVTGNRGMIYGIQNFGALKLNGSSLSGRLNETGECCALCNESGSSAEVIDTLFKAVYAGMTPGSGALACNNIESILRAKGSTFYGDAKEGDSAGSGAKCCYSYGIRSTGVAYLDDCTVTGTFAGLGHYGTELYVNGGTYTGTQHGGIYFGHDPETISYVNDAVLKDGNYDGEFQDDWNPKLHSRYLWGAIYVGGGTVEDPNCNMHVYMDGCTFHGYKHAIAMRGSHGEQNNTIYLSRCIFGKRNGADTDCTINYHNNTHHVIVGSGCNFDTDHIFTDPTQKVQIVDSMMIFTGQTYRKFDPNREITAHEMKGQMKTQGCFTTVTSESYFEITDDGMVYLKPEYRGAVSEGAANSEFGKYITSDRGFGKVGSRNSELPDEIVIPDMIGDIPVNSVSTAMFLKNPAVRRVKLPSCITEIPKMCFQEAGALEEVNGTENVTIIASQAFYKTPIRKALFPKLQEFTGKNQFTQCSKLCVVDIGDVTTIPDGCFIHCVRLHTIRNGKNVTSVGVGGLHNTNALKTPSFVPGLKMIHNLAFLYSRVDYDWNSLVERNNCQFGEIYPTTAQMNPTDWWSGCTKNACKIPLGSTFDQTNPRWADIEMVPGQLTWMEGCTMCACAHIYSALERKTLSSPAEFIKAALEKDPTLTQYIIGMKSTHIKYLEAVGYTVETINQDTGKELIVGNDLQILYDALYAGHMVLISVPRAEKTEVAHCVVLYGINESGEVMFVDSDGEDHVFGEYKAGKGCMPIQTFTKGICDFIVVKKG